MPRTRPTTQDHEPTFLPRRIVSAADRAAAEVLEEDFLLRRYGITPTSRTR